MAKISELPNSATPLTGEETFPVVQLGITKKAQISDIKMTVDTEISDTSENPVQNKIVKAYTDGLTKYRVISDVTITEDIDTYSVSQDSSLSLIHISEPTRPY